MRILRELAAMDMPDGLTVEGPRAPDGSGELVRSRVAPPWEAHESDGESAPGQIIVREAPVAAWQGLLGMTGQRGAIPLWGPESKERAIIAHMTHRVRQRLRETGYGHARRQREREGEENGVGDRRNRDCGRVGEPKGCETCARMAGLNGRDGHSEEIWIGGQRKGLFKPWNGRRQGIDPVRAAAPTVQLGPLRIKRH